MFCPFCGSEMKEGSLVTGLGRRFLWIPKAHLPNGFLDFVPLNLCILPKVQEKYGAVFLDGNTDEGRYITHLEVSMCWHCGKGVLSISAADHDVAQSSQSD